MQRRQKSKNIMNTFKIKRDGNLARERRLSGAIIFLILATSAAFGAADLVPQSITVGPPTVDAGRAVTVSYTVRNQGDTNAPSSQTKVQIKNAESLEVVVQDFTTPAIKANASVRESREVIIPLSAAAGVYKAFVILDNKSEVAQDGAPRSNMSAGTAFTVQAAVASAADLVPQLISVSPATVNAGSSVTVSFTARNQGDTSAPASQTKIQIKNSASLEVVAQDCTTQAINANSAVSESCAVLIPASAAAGVYKVFVILDNNSEVAQGGATRNNMSAGTAFTVQAATPR